MEKEMITPGALEAVLANPSPSEPFDIVVQVMDLKPVGSNNTRFTFFANDGKMKLKAMLPTSMAGEVISGKLQNLGLIRIVEYTCNNIQNKRHNVGIEACNLHATKDGVLSEKELIQPRIYTPRRPVISTDRPVVSTEAADAKRVFGGKIGTTSFQAPTTERLSYVPSSDTKRMGQEAPLQSSGRNHEALSQVFLKRFHSFWRYL